MEHILGLLRLASDLVMIAFRVDYRLLTLSLYVLLNLVDDVVLVQLERVQTLKAELVQDHVVGKHFLRGSLCVVIFESGIV